MAEIREMLVGCDWRTIVAQGGASGWRTATAEATNYLRDVANPLNAADLGTECLAVRYRAATGRVARAWVLSSGRDGLAELRNEIGF